MLRSPKRANQRVRTATTTTILARDCLGRLLSAGWSRLRLSAEVGMTRQALRDIERGRTSAVRTATLAALRAVELYHPGPEARDDNQGE